LLLLGSRKHSTILPHTSTNSNSIWIFMINESESRERESSRGNSVIKHFTNSKLTGHFTSTEFPCGMCRTSIDNAPYLDYQAKANFSFFFLSFAVLAHSLSILRHLADVFLHWSTNYSTLHTSRTFSRITHVILHSSGYTQSTCCQGGGPCEGLEKRWRTTTTSVRGV